MSESTGRSNTGGAAGHASSTSAAKRFNDYADLLNDFQELVDVAVDRRGQGLQTYRLGPDLSPEHRDLLNDLRKVLIDGQPGAPADKRQSAAADWRNVSARLKADLDEARTLNIPSGVTAAVRDQIAVVGEKYLNIRPKGPSEVESGDDYADTVNAVQRLLYEFNQMGEGSLGMQRENVAGRPDAVVGMGTRELNAKQREKIEAVKLGWGAVERHRVLVEKLRETMLLARSEQPGSAYKALSQWNAIRSELAYVMGRAPNYVQFNADALTQTLNEFDGAIEKHYELVHTETLATALKAPPKPGEAQAEKILSQVGAKEALAQAQEWRMLGDFRHVLEIVENGITPVPGRPGEWLLKSGAVQVRIRDDQVTHLRTVAATQLKGYMAHLVEQMVAASENYDSIKRANSSFKLHVLGGLGGASDPGSQENYRLSTMHVRDTQVYPMVDRGEYLKAFNVIISQKGVVERQFKEVTEYDSDLDVGYNRLARRMQLLQVALTALVPVAGQAALTSGYGLVAVGGTAVASGTVAPLLAEGTREIVSGEGLQADKLFSAGHRGFTISTGAITGPLAKGLGAALGAGKSGVAGMAGDMLADGMVGGLQSVAAGESFKDGFVESAVSNLGGQAARRVGITGRVGTTLASAGSGAAGAWASGGDSLAGLVGGGISPVGEIVSNANMRARSGGEKSAPTLGKGDATYRGPALTNGEPLYAVPAIDANNNELASKRAANPDSPEPRDVKTSGHGVPNRVEKGNAYAFRRSTDAAEVAEAADYAAQRGAKEIHILTNAHGGLDESGFGITDSKAERFFPEDARTQGIIQDRYPDTTVILHDALDPVQFDQFIKAQARASSGERGVATIAGFCDSVGLFPEGPALRAAVTAGGPPAARATEGPDNSRAQTTAPEPTLNDLGLAQDELKRAAKQLDRSEGLIYDAKAEVERMEDLLKNPKEKTNIDKVRELLAAAERRATKFQKEHESIEAKFTAAEFNVDKLTKKLTALGKLHPDFQHEWNLLDQPTTFRYKGAKAKSWRIDALVTPSQNRQAVARFLNTEPDGPLSKVLLDPNSGPRHHQKLFAAQVGDMEYWQAHPEIIEKAHVWSNSDNPKNATDGLRPPNDNFREVCIVMTKARNRMFGSNHEHASTDGAVFKEDAIVIQGIAIDRQSAIDLGVPQAVIDSAPVITFAK